MSACGYRPEDGCALVACSSAFPDHKCRCSEDVKGELSERKARVPDSAREEAG